VQLAITMMVFNTLASCFHENLFYYFYDYLTMKLTLGEKGQEIGENISQEDFEHNTMSMSVS
jgi:hypothetical protein